VAEPGVSRGEAQVGDEDGELGEGGGHDEEGLRCEGHLAPGDERVQRQVPGVDVPPVKARGEHYADGYAGAEYL